MDMFELVDFCVKNNCEAIIDGDIGIEVAQIVLADCGTHVCWMPLS